MDCMFLSPTPTKQSPSKDHAQNIDFPPTSSHHVAAVEPNYPDMSPMVGSGE